jgi:hypothetical protein
MPVPPIVTVVVDIRTVPPRQRVTEDSSRPNSRNLTHHRAETIDPRHRLEANHDSACTHTLIRNEARPSSAL